MGRVPEKIPTVPLQADFEKNIKSLRLSDLLKNSMTQKIELDLRQPPQLKKSQFFHRCRLLELDFADEKASTGREKSTFNEYWEAKWQPEIVLRLIEKSVWGRTMEEAATHFSVQKMTDETRLAPLLYLLDELFKADLLQLVDRILKKIEDLAATTTDTILLLEALPVLVRVMRYGTARKTDISTLKTVVLLIFPRICVGLPAACAGLNEAISDEILPKILATNRVADQISSDSETAWVECLNRVARQNSTAPKIAGAAVRLLFDRAFFDKKEAAVRMSFSLSRGANAADASAWLDGFLSGSGLLLVHQNELWDILDEWVLALSEDNFREILPLLRRTFSRFSAPERQKLLEKSRLNASILNEKQADSEVDFNWKLGEKSLDGLRDFF
jgi:hypothetical protein